MWSEWSDWGKCSASCDGGIQSRTRQCNRLEGDEAEGDCPGSATDEQLCNKQSCDPGMVYWKNHYPHPIGHAIKVRPELLSSGECVDTEKCFEDCVGYCLSYQDDNGDPCTLAQLSYKEYFNAPQYSEYNCYIRITQEVSGASREYIKTTPYFVISQHFGYTMKFYNKLLKSKPEFVQLSPDGTMGGKAAEIEGLCDETNTGFGIVNFKNAEATEFISLLDKNIIRDSNSDDCAAKCFEAAGCSSFFVDDNGCNYIIGFTSNAIQNDKVTKSGILHDVCPANAFHSKFTKVSIFYCLMWSPDESESVADSIVEQNLGNADIPLRQWSFETKGNNPMITSSQYVSLTMTNMRGENKRWRPIYFAIETHVRVGNKLSRKRRTADEESVEREDWTLIGELTDQKIEKLLKKAEKEAKQASYQRSIMPRTDEILAQIDSIEQQAVNFILEGGMELPAGVEVAATSPVETIQFVQTAADGSIAADCSSGSCQCSVGFVDNGDGCSEEQLTTTPASTTMPTTTSTTKAPTTKTPTTTSTNTAGSARDWIPSLVDKMETILENDRPGKLLYQLLSKWKKLGKKFVRRTEDVTKAGCVFADTYEDDSVDFNSVDSCQVSLDYLASLMHHD